MTEDFSSRLLRLPFYNDLAEEDQARIVDVVTGFKMRNVQERRHDHPANTRRCRALTE